MNWEKWKIKRMLVHTILLYNRMTLIHNYMKTVDKQSFINTEPEVTVICVDNTTLLTEFGGGGAHKAQAKAIALYSKEKIRAHLRNEVGLLGMGMLEGTCFVRPTRDLDAIRFALKSLVYIGQSCIPIGHALSFFTNSKLPKRRLLVFSGGRLSMGSVQLQFFAKRLKEFNVAVDVINFGMQFFPETKKKLLQEFVEAADNNGNSHYLYAPSGSRTSLGQQILQCSPLAPGCPLTQEEKKKKEEVEKNEKAIAKMKKKKLHMTKNLNSALAPGGLSMREAKKKERQVKKMDNMEKQRKRKVELAKKEEEEFRIFIRSYLHISLYSNNDK